MCVLLGLGLNLWRLVCRIWLFFVERVWVFIWDVGRCRWFYGIEILVYGVMGVGVDNVGRIVGCLGFFSGLDR